MPLSMILLTSDSFQNVPTIETTMLHDHDELGVMPSAVPVVSPIGASSQESHDMPPVVEISEEPPVTDTVENIGRGHRSKIPSIKLQDCDQYHL